LLKQTPEHSPDRFERRWLAEAIRLLEAGRGPLADADAVRMARLAGGTLEDRVLVRAQALGAREGLLDALRDWRGIERLGLIVVALLALSSGFGVALGVLGDGSRPVNVVWALGGLLGLHVVGLVVWLIGMWFGGRDAGGLLGKAWQWLARRMARSGPAVLLGRARTDLLAGAGLNRWALGAVTHLVWLLALLGALAGMVLLFMLRGYQFTWETTILSGDFLARLVATLGWLPGMLGFEVPDATTVKASGAGMLAVEEARRAWAQWLLGCVLVYGVVPRGLLWAGCRTWFRRQRAALALDLGMPDYLVLSDRLMPASERIGVTDPDHADTARAANRHTHVAGAGAPTVIGIELRPERSWPPTIAEGVVDGGRVDDRIQRKEALARLAAQPPARLLLACDARLSPDRGNLGLIGEMSACAADCRVWLMDGTAPDNPRLAHWMDGLARLGFESHEIIGDEGRALAWLAHGDE